MCGGGVPSFNALMFCKYCMYCMYCMPCVCCMHCMCCIYCMCCMYRTAEIIIAGGGREFLEVGGKVEQQVEGSG